MTRYSFEAAMESLLRALSWAVTTKVVGNGKS
jgi:hypothetical protein